jgi:hypothetical protein
VSHSLVLYRYFSRYYLRHLIEFWLGTAEMRRIGTPEYLVCRPLLNLFGPFPSSSDPSMVRQADASSGSSNSRRGSQPTPIDAGATGDDIGG